MAPTSAERADGMADLLRIQDLVRDVTTKATGVDVVWFYVPLVLDG